MSKMLSKMNLISVVQQLPKEDIETAKELAEKCNVKPETIEFYASPSYLKRLEKVKDKYNKGFVCVRLT